MYIILYKHMTVHDMYVLVLLSHHIELKMLTFTDVCGLSLLFNLGEAFSFSCKFWRISSHRVIFSLYGQKQKYQTSNQK